jgi:hypothetical protein
MQMRELNGNAHCMGHEKFFINMSCSFKLLFFKARIQLSVEFCCSATENGKKIK